jgi:hypothetical protein
MRRMVIVMPELTGYASVRHIAVSVPYAHILLDGVKYLEPDNLPPPEGTELRRQRAPRGPGRSSPGTRNRFKRPANREAKPVPPP